VIPDRTAGRMDGWTDVRTHRTRTPRSNDRRLVRDEKAETASEVAAAGTGTPGPAAPLDPLRNRRAIEGARSRRASAAREYSSKVSATPGTGPDPGRTRLDVFLFAVGRPRFRTSRPSVPRKGPRRAGQATTRSGPSARRDHDAPGSPRPSVRRCSRRATQRKAPADRHSTWPPPKHEGPLPFLARFVWFGSRPVVRKRPPVRRERAADDRRRDHPGSRVAGGLSSGTAVTGIR